MGNVELLHAAYQKQVFSPHFHEGHVIGVIEKGFLGFDYRGQKHVAGPGDINMADPGEVHNGFAVSEDGWQYRMFYFGPDQLSQMLNDGCDGKSLEPFFKKGVIRDAWFAGQIHALHRDFENPDIFSLEKESRFYSLMTGFIQKYSLQKANLNPPGSEKNRVKKIKEYILNHYDTEISLGDLSQVTGISRYYLLRLFEKETGLTPHAYLNLVRVKKARQMMANHVPIIEAAHAAGFFDQSHLNRIFKKIYGITPGQFCEKKRKIL